MKKKMFYLIIIITVINLVAMGTIIYQRWLNPENSCVPMQKVRFEQVKNELALSPVQIARFEEIRYDFHTGIDSLNQLLEGQNRVLLQEIWKAQPDAARIDTLLHRISKLQMESQQRVIDHFYQFRKVLTPEQWQTFYGIVAERFPGRMKNSGSRQPAATEKDSQ